LILCFVQDRVEADRENFAAALMAQQSNYHLLLGGSGLLVQRIHLIMPQLREHDNDMLRILLSETTQMTDEERESQRLTAFLEHHRMCLSVYAYEQEDLIVPVAIMEFPMDMWTLPPTAVNTTVAPEPLGSPESASNNLRNARTHRRDGPGPDPNTRVLSGSLQLQSLREMGRNLRGFQHPLRFRFVLGTRSLNNSCVELARSDLVDIGDPNFVTGAFGGNFVASNVPGINFEIRHLEGRDDRPRELDSVVWYTSERNFLAYALECIVQGHEAQWRRIMHSPPGPETAILID